MHTHTPTHTHTHIHTVGKVCLRVCICTYNHIHTHKCVCAYICTHTNTHAHTHNVHTCKLVSGKMFKESTSCAVYMYVCVYIHKYTFIHIYRHACILSPGEMFRGITACAHTYISTPIHAYYHLEKCSETTLHAHIHT